MCVVGYGDRATQPSIELTQDIRAEAPASVKPTGGHISIHVPDLTALCADLEKEGIEFGQQLHVGGNTQRTPIS